MATFKNIDLLIFDFDGTLLDSKEDLAQSINKVLTMWSLQPLPVDRVWAFLGDGAQYLVDRCFSYRGVKTPKHATEIFLKDYETNSLKKTKLYPNIEEVLHGLCGFRKAILTNKRHDFTMKICKGLGIETLFDMILGRKDFKKKPDPEGIFLIMNDLNASKEKTVMIGDTSIDMLAGERAGVKRIAVTWGVHKREDLIKCNPDALIDDIRQLKEIISH